MRKEEKQEIVQALTERIKSYGSFYITDTADLTVEKVNGIRRKCFEQGIAIQVVKNSLIKKALIEAGIDTAELDGALKGASTMLFSEVGNAPAKLIKQLRKEGDKPVLKAVRDRLERLVETADQIRHLPLKGQFAGLYKLRVFGKYRVIYDLQRERQVIVIVRVGNRSDIYEE